MKDSFVYYISEATDCADYLKRGVQATVLLESVLLPIQGVAEESLLSAGAEYQSYFEDDYSQHMKQLRDFSYLPNNWDGYGAEPVNKKAIQNVESLLGRLPGLLQMSIDVQPTHHGAILLKSQTFSGNLLKCEIGDTQVSYFIRKQDEGTRYFSFVDWNDKTCDAIIKAIENLL